MHPSTRGAAALAVAIVASLALGLWLGRSGIVSGSAASSERAHDIKDAAAPAPERKVKYYRNPMGQPDTSPVPKKDSMGMDYIPVYEGEDTGDTGITLSPGRIQRTGVETAAVTRRVISRTIRAPGVVTLDERNLAVVAPRFDGFVESVAAVTSGTHVKKGDALLTVFGQQLLNEGARLLIEEAPGYRGGEPANTAASAGGVIGAKRRLLNLGAPEELIDQIRRDRRVPDTITLRAPIDGVVLERNAIDGQAFKPGDVMFRIADHATIWVIADVAESDIGALKTGQDVKVTTHAYEGRVFVGKVGVIYPHLMKETRTARVRIELANADLALLPDMYGEVEIATGTGEAVLAVPTGAVIDSGSRQVVLRDQGEGRFEPVAVTLGRRGDGYVEVAGEINENDKIVVNGNFLIDAESNLQSALKGFAPANTEPAPPSPQPAPANHHQHDEAAP